MPLEEEKRPKKCQLAEMLFTISRRYPEIFSAINPAMMLATKQCREQNGEVQFPSSVPAIHSTFFYQDLCHASKKVKPFVPEDPVFKKAHEALEAGCGRRKSIMLSQLSG